MYQVTHSGKEFACQYRRCKRHGFYPWCGKITQRRKWQPTLLFLLGEFHGQRSLVDYGSWITKSQTQLSNLACTHTVPLYNVIKLCLERCYSFSSIHCLALAVGNLMARYTSPCTMTLIFLEEPLCAISPQEDLLMSCYHQQSASWLCVNRLPENSGQPIFSFHVNSTTSSGHQDLTIASKTLTHLTTHAYETSSSET